MPHNDKHKARAHRALRQEIVMGRITRPDTCAKCGDTPGRGRDGRSLIHGHHHKGYDYPLDVEWLCVQCHRKETPLPEGERSNTARLTDAQAIFIKGSSERTDVLAERFGVGISAIKRARAGSTWKHLQALAVIPTQGAETLQPPPQPGETV